MLQPLSPQAKSFKPGIYRHYRGDDYRALHVARHEATGEEMVVYLALYGEYAIWVRPLGEFVTSIEIAGQSHPRFNFLHE